MKLSLLKEFYDVCYHLNILFYISSNYKNCLSFVVLALLLLVFLLNLMCILNKINLLVLIYSLSFLCIHYKFCYFLMRCLLFFYQCLFCEFHLLIVYLHYYLLACIRFFHLDSLVLLEYSFLLILKLRQSLLAFQMNVLVEFLLLCCLLYHFFSIHMPSYQLFHLILYNSSFYFQKLQLVCLVFSLPVLQNILLLEYFYHIQVLYC